MIVRTLLTLSLVFQSSAFAGNPAAGSLTRQSWDHLIDRMALDIATLSAKYGNSENAMTVTVETDTHGTRAILIKGANGEVLHRIDLFYGTDAASEELPVRMQLNGVILDLRQDWNSILSQMHELRGMYDSVKSDQHPSFEEHIRQTKKLETMLNPMKVKVANFLKDGLHAPLMRESRELAARAALDRMGAVNRADRLANRIEIIVGVATLALLGNGVWDAFQQSSMNYHELATHSNLPFYGIMVSAATGILSVINQMGVFLDVDECRSFFNTWLTRRAEARAYDQQDRERDAEYNAYRAGAEKIYEETRAKAPVDYQFGKVTVRNHLGSLTEIKADAWLLPEFPWGSSDQQVGAAVIAAGGQKGLEEFDAFVAEKWGSVPYGTVHFTSSGEAAAAKQFIHVVTVGAGKSASNEASAIRADFNAVKSVFLSALKEAEARGIKSIATPLLATGVLGNLVSYLSQQAMLEAIAEFNAGSPKAKIQVTLAVYGDPFVYGALEKRLAQVQQSGIHPNPAFAPLNGERCEELLVGRGRREL